VIAEEFPARRRGLAISVLLAAGVAGGVAAAFALGPAMETRLGWRAMYVIGLIPLLLVIPLRRGIRETPRYIAMDGARAGGPASRSGMFAVWQRPHLRTTILCILLFGLVGAIATTFASFYPYFLANERGFSPSQVSRTYGIAALMGLPAIPLAGWLLDRWGRRSIGIVGPILAAAGVACAFQASGSPEYIALVGMAAVFFGTFSLPIQVAYVPELFPTHMRSLAMSWVGNGAGRALVILVPALAGALAVRVGSVGLAASIIAVCGLAAAWIVFAHMPETKGVPLEQTAESAGWAGSRATRE
jgi:MFS family permease